MNSTIDYSIVIPVYNSSSSLTELVVRIHRVFQEILAKSYEIIFVDDGSPNVATWKTLEKLSSDYSTIKAIQLTRNFGKPGALICGLTEAKGNYIITMDDDLQHLPEDIPALVMHQEHDAVIGGFQDKKHSISKKIFSSLNNWFESKLIGKPRHIRSSPFKLIKKEIVDAMLEIKTPYPSIAALLYYVTKDAVMVTVSHGERSDNVSGFTFRKMLRSFSNLVINNSAGLLQLIAGMGIAISIISSLLALYFFLKKLIIGINVTGWTSLMIAVTVLGGLILFSIGVVGEYLIRIINGVERKPAFIIRKKKNGN